MFLNLSNHPSSLWSSDQLKAAMSLAETIEDMGFPNVPPDADETALDAMAEETAAAVLSKKPTIVHLMGELTLCHRIVNILKTAGMTVLASTTERDVVMEGKDLKKVRFRFIRFRSY